MIYVDTSVLLAAALEEERRPPDSLWTERVVSSRLLQYEAWAVLHARGQGKQAGEYLSRAIARIDMVEMLPEHLGRALEPFPVPLRALDAIHLATAHRLRELGEDVTIAVYDGRLRTAAVAMGFAIAEV